MLTMTPLRDDAIVLRLAEYSETSQIVTLFGAAHGQLRLIAKGVRRSTKTRVAAGLDLLEYGAVGFIPPHGDAQLGILTEWTQRDAFAGLRREAQRLYGALYAVETVAALTEEADPHPELFTALEHALQTLAGDTPAGPAIVRFQNALLQAIGYAPNLTACVNCGGDIRRGAPVFFSSTAGGLLCRDCELHFVEKRRVPPHLLAPPGAGSAEAWFELLDYHLTHVAGRRFKTAAVLAGALGRGLPKSV
jgi:DNA repair protein RecO (recombination protein O)